MEPSTGPVANPGERLPGQVGRWRESVPKLTWGRGLAILALFLVTLFTAKSCQQSQIRVSQGRAVATARTRIDFVPERTQVRLVRQGLNGEPVLGDLVLDPDQERPRLRPPDDGARQRQHGQGRRRQP